MKATTPTSEARWLTQGKLVILLGMLVSALTLSFAAVQIASERNRSIALWRQSAEAESSALAAHALQTLTAADLVLKSVIERANSTGVSTPEEMRRALGSRDVHEMLRDRQSGVPQISVASIIDIDGDMVNFTRNFPPRSNSGERINLKERDYFQAHLKDPNLDLFLSEPVENKGNGTWTFYLARKLRSPDGAMLGVVLAGLESDYFQDFYKQISAPGKAYGLFHLNGSNLARWPMAEGVVGANYSDAAVFRLFRENQRSAVLEPGEAGVAKGSGEEMRIVAPTAVKNYPAMVSVRISSALVLDSWRRSMVSTLTLAFGLSLITAVMTIVVFRLLRRNALVIADLETARALSEVAARAKTDFLATMSHEIRTPMNAVVGLINLLAQTRLTEEQRRMVQVASESADGLLHVVNDVLDFSSLDSSRQTLMQESFSVPRLVETAMATARAYPGADLLTLSSEIAPDVPEHVVGDRTSLSRLLLNLLHNAIKFTQQGAVTLSVQTVPDPSAATGRRLTFAVRDSGSGVPEAMQEKIFEPFEQASNGRLSPHRGTGLGLAICRRIADAMGGELKLASVEGLGSVFTCTLPMEIGAPPMAEAVEPVADTLKGRSLRVLVAEDTPASQMVVRMVLEGMGHQVRVVSDGAQAVRAFAEESFDLVLLDIQMPVLNGFEAARAIRAAIAAGGKATRIAGLSAFAQTSDRNAAIDAGMDDYLAKPIRPADLAALLNRLSLSSDTDAAQLPSAQNAAPELTAQDAAIMGEFYDVMGSAGFEEAIATFEHDTLLVLDDLSRLAADGKDVEAGEAAHRLKGVLSQFGAADAAALAARIEKMPPSVRAAPIAELVATCPAAIAMVRQTADALVAQRKAAKRART